MATRKNDVPDGRGSEKELLTVIIPCFNEEHTVRAAVDAVLEESERLPVEIQVVLVDDGSTDRTAQAMDEIVAEHPSCRIRRNPRNLGIGRSVLASYDEIPERSWVTVFPGDNEYLFPSIRNHLALRDRYDVILGYVQNPVIRPFARRLASEAFTKTASTIYGFSFRYLNGMKLYRVEAFRGIEVRSSGHAFNAELLAKAILRNPALRIGEVPFVVSGRARGYSKAFRPKAAVLALQDLVIGNRSVVEYRRRVVEGF